MSDTTVPSALCTVLGCTAPLHLVLFYDVPLYTVDPPWPGAGAARYDAQGANTHQWEVGCEDGHTVWTPADQARAANAAGERDEDGEELTEDSDWPTTFDPRYLRQPVTLTVGDDGPTVASQVAR